MLYIPAGFAHGFQTRSESVGISWAPGEVQAEGPHAAGQPVK
jgi:dTDP-4-dehydrorhamnose 3,5-epimerase-like enzyme